MKADVLELLDYVSQLNDAEFEALEKRLQKISKTDSITIGSASKGGQVKIYHDFSDPEGFKDKIMKAADVAEFAKQKLGRD